MWGHAETAWGESCPHMHLCNRRCCFHPNFDTRCICICVKSFSNASYWACNKKIPVQNPASPSLSRHSTECLEFQVPTAFLLSKQLSECFPTYKHSLLLSLTLGWKQPDLWLLTGFWFPGYYYVDSFVMQEAGMPCNIKSTPIKIPHDNITL